MTPTTEAVKVVVLGGPSAGKTSLIVRFAHDDFGGSAAATATIAGAFFTKQVMVGTDKVKLHIWDTAGSEVYQSITRMYYRGAQAGILCYDVADYVSFTKLQFWMQELLMFEPECRLYLCGCKLDLDNLRQVPLSEAKQLAIAKNAAFYETSARTGQNVDALFNRISGDAINWNFVSIVSGDRRQLRAASSCGRRGGAGRNASFKLTDQRDAATPAETASAGCVSSYCGHA